VSVEVTAGGIRRVTAMESCGKIIPDFCGCDSEAADAICTATSTNENAKGNVL